MKTIKINQRKAWTDTDNKEIISLYNTMLSYEHDGKKYVKAKLIRDYTEKMERSKGSIECKLMNVSAIRQNVLNLGIVHGFKPLNNYNHDLAVLVCSQLGYDYIKE